MDQRATLEAQKLTLNKQAGSLTASQQSLLTAINAQLDQIAVAAAALITKDEPTAAPDTDAAGKQAAKEELLKQVVVFIAPPPPGALNIVHSTVAANDMLSYMKFTQYLNPYGRKRQCDTDLENIMGVLSGDISNQLAEYIQLGKTVVKAAAP